MCLGVDLLNVFLSDWAVLGRVLLVKQDQNWTQKV